MADRHDSGERAVSPYDRRHDAAQPVARDATVVLARRHEVRPLFRAFAGSARARGCPCFSGLSRIAGHILAIAEPDRLRVAVLLRCDVEPGRDTRADCLCPDASQVARDLEPRRGGAFSRGGSVPEGARCTDHRLCRWLARIPHRNCRRRLCHQDIRAVAHPLRGSKTLAVTLLAATSSANSSPFPHPPACHKIHSAARASAGSFNPASMRSHTAPDRPHSAARPHRTLQIHMRADL